MGGHDEKDKWVVRSTEGVGDTFEHILARRLSRRDLLRSAAVASSVAIIGSAAIDGETAAAQRITTPRFAKIAPTAPEVDDVKVPEGYFARTLIRWGEPLTAEAPLHNVWEQTPQAQAQQFGYNCDFVGYLGLPFGSGASSRGLLVVNHEYTNPELMFAGYDPKNPTRNQVDIELAAHGVSVVEIQRAASGEWSYVRSSSYNRRLTGETPHRISGPAAGHPWMMTSEDPTGTTVRGTLNNCAGGKTPWGTVLTAEENFHQYFANFGPFDTNDVRYGIHDGLFAVPVQGPERGRVQQFFSTVAGSEVCGPEFTPDNRTLFLAIQHPGEGGTFEEPISTWPDRVGLPRPSVITIQAFDSRAIGS